MLSSLDASVESLPLQVRLPEIYVDDATVVVVGRVVTVVNVATKAAFALVHVFEGCGLPVSETNAKVTASSMTLGHLIARKLKDLGCQLSRR